MAIHAPPPSGPATRRLGMTMRRALARQREHLSSGTLILAVSGGADSLAMLLASRETGLALRQRIIAAHFSHGLRPTADVRECASVRRTAEALGVLAHSIRDQEVDDAFIALARERGVCQLPTLSRELSTFIYADRPEFLDDPFFSKHEDPSVVQTLKSDEYVQQAQSNPNLSRYRANLVMAQKNLKKLHEGGVKIGFATDTGPPGRIQGFFEHVELELMVEAGLTPAAALKAATSASAECLGDENLGALTPGRQADFIVLDADPIEDIKNTSRITSVWQRGVQVRGPIL